MVDDARPTPDEALAIDYADMIVAKWRGFGQPAIDLGGALLVAAMNILLVDEGMSRTAAAESLRDIADIVEHGGKIDADVLRKH